MKLIKYIYIVMFFLSLTSCAQNKVTLYSKKHKIYPKINIPLSADKLLSNAADDFNKNFRALTGQYLTVERANSLNNNYNYVIIRVNPTQKDSYCLYKKGRNITIQGKTTQDLVYGINTFFKKYTSLTLNDIENTIQQKNTKSEIEIPSEFSSCSSPDFEYREPYFSTNFNVDFRA